MRGGLTVSGNSESTERREVRTEQNAFGSGYERPVSTAPGELTTGSEYANTTSYPRSRKAKVRELTLSMREIIEAQGLQDRLVEKYTAIPGINLLMFGKPGTGKTTSALRKHASQFAAIYMTTVTEWTPASEWRGFFIPKPDPATGSPGMGWHDGLAARAMGHITDIDGSVKLDQDLNRFVINEIDKAGPDLEALLYPLCDEREIAEIHLPNGDVLRSQEGLQIIGTGNEPPDALLPPVQDRFTFRIRVDWPSQEAIEALPIDLQDFCLKVAALDGDQYISYREVKAFGTARDKMGFDPLTAAHAVWGWKGEGVAEQIVNSYSLAKVGSA